MINFNVKSSGQGKSLRKRLVILQWGTKRSIVKDIIDEKLYIINNQELMNLDEMGLVQ